MIAVPLFHLTEKHQTGDWTLQCNAAFFKLKESLVTSPVLEYPVLSNGYVVDTDASGEGLGAVLSQNIEGHDHVIAYASRTLNKAERKYCATILDAGTCVGYSTLQSIPVWKAIYSTY